MDCGAQAPRAARWCGRCGAPCRVSAPPPAPAQWRAGAIVAAAAVTIVAAVLAAGGVLRPDTTAVGAVPADTPVEVAPQQVPEAAPGTDAAAATVPACVWLDGRNADCGRTVVDDLRSLSALAALSNSTVVVAHRGGEVAAVDLLTGWTRWVTLVYPGADDLGLRVDDDRVLVTTDGRVALLDGQTGHLRWTHATDGIRPPRAWSLADGVLALTAEGHLRALDLDDGSLRWEAEAPDDDGILTPAGLVTASRDRTVLWHPGDGVVWERTDDARPRLVPRDQRPEGPLPLSGGGLLVPTTGERLDDIELGPTLLRVAGPLTLELRWRVREASLTVVARGAGGAVVWERTGLPVPCCIAAVVPASGGRVAIAPPGPAATLLSLTDGELLGQLAAPGDLSQPNLEAVVGDVALWHTPDGIVGATADGTTPLVALHEGARILSVEPLLVAGPGQVVALSAGAGDQPPYAAAYRGLQRR